MSRLGLIILTFFVITLNLYSGDSLYVTVQKIDIPNVPDSTKFVKQMPNPFSLVIGFTFTVKEKSLIKVELYNNDGNYLYLIIYNEFNPGKYNVTYNASTLKSGIYYLKLICGDIIDSQITMFVK